ELAARFEEALPGLDAARDALRAAQGDFDVAAGRDASPDTWSSATAALTHALREVEHLRAIVASTPGLLKSCADGYTSGDQVAAKLLGMLARESEPPPPLTLSDVAPALPPGSHAPAAVERTEVSAAAPPFRVPQFTPPAIEFAAHVAGVRPREPVPSASPRPAAGPTTPPGATTLSPSGTTPRDPSPAPAAPLTPDPPRSTPSGDARRAEILRRARRWADLGLGYSMTHTFEGYRTDCSGLVSMAWGLPAPGLTTDTLDQVAHRIDKKDLLPGDVLVNTAPGAAGHTLIFAGWTDGSRTRYFAYEESGGKGAHFGTVPYPYWPGHGTFRPYRLDALGK
ncbi:MAG: hypothetical protein HOV68_20985, partial [Streptomycetaceae bacterium]|nr:hypothetical protein [Streptomycetaceae bacterium]